MSNDLPSAGGSYLRQKDGTLVRMDPTLPPVLPLSEQGANEVLQNSGESAAVGDLSNVASTQHLTDEEAI